MALLGPLLSLALCLLLTRETFAKNDAPCQLSKWNNGHNTFLKRHIPSGTPSSLDQNAWGKYIRENTGCSRPTQSFLSAKDLDRVREVCTKAGGKTYKENLCISSDQFTFVTVRSEPDTCGIRSVREETKHLILACEQLGNECLPVHFEGNPQNSKPNNNARACQNPESKNDAPSLKTTRLCFIALLLLLVYGY